MVPPDVRSALAVELVPAGQRRERSGATVCRVSRHTAQSSGAGVFGFDISSTDTIAFIIGSWVFLYRALTRLRRQQNLDFVHCLKSLDRIPASYPEKGIFWKIFFSLHAQAFFNTI